MMMLKIISILYLKRFEIIYYSINISAKTVDSEALSI